MPTNRLVQKCALVLVDLRKLRLDTAQVGGGVYSRLGGQKQLAGSQ